MLRFHMKVYVLSRSGTCVFGADQMGQKEPTGEEELRTKFPCSTLRTTIPKRKRAKFHNCCY